ncbi:hypothetical protein DFH29DRAFT_995942 [Suillus ampliporus]|nr:hypothetical protein DFH29DRAFT_995942 [Suillus ampliporus]
MAARNFEDLLQVRATSPQNQIVQDLLFTLAHWHGLSKLRMHSDLTLDILDATTTDIGNQLRDFKVKVCSAHDAKELDKEVNTHSRHQAKEAVRRTQAGKNNKSVTNGLLTTTMVEEPVDRNKLHRTVSFNLQTYKIHALGDYVSCIRCFGTTDSYSTEPGELEHRTGKRRYLRTDRKSFIRQLTQIERRQTRIRCIKNCLEEPRASEAADSMTYKPCIHHHIGLSEKSNDDIGSYLRLHEGDPAMKNYFSRLKEHLLLHILTSQPGDSCQQVEGGTDQVLFKRNRIYHHNIARFNYTTYDTRQDQDVINPKTLHHDIMLLNSTSDNSDCGGRYRYARVLGVHHVNIVYTGGPYHTALRMEFLFVRWYEPVGHANPGRTALDRLYFPALDSEDAFGFLSPADVMRAAHIIPCFSKEMRHKDGKGLSGIAGDKSDWCQYFVNRFVDRDMLMRFHYGLGVGHVYSHEEALNPPPKTISLDEAPCNEQVGRNEYELEDALEDDHTGVEEGDLFDQEKNQSSELIVEELDDISPNLNHNINSINAEEDSAGPQYPCVADAVGVVRPKGKKGATSSSRLYRLELEAQFWKHVEFFPRDFKLDRIFLRQLRTELDWFHTDALTLESSTSATIFSNRETMEKLINRLASLDDLSESEGIITEPGVALLGRLYHMLRHHQYLNYFGQPEARLLQTHSMGPGTRMQGPFPFILTAAMLCLPVLVHKHLKQIYVDGLVNYLDLKNFIDDFNTQNNAQITLAGVIMAINASFLAVQGVGTGLVAESMLKGSIIFCVGCLFAGMFAQHFSKKLKSLQFAVCFILFSAAKV